MLSRDALIAAGCSPEAAEKLAALFGSEKPIQRTGSRSEEPSASEQRDNEFASIGSLLPKAPLARRLPLALSARETALIRWLRVNPSNTSAILESVTGLTERGVRKLVRRLEARGLIAVRPGTGHSYSSYRVLVGSSLGGTEVPPRAGAAPAPNEHSGNELCLGTPLAANARARGASAKSARATSPVTPEEKNSGRGAARADRDDRRMAFALCVSEGFATQTAEKIAERHTFDTVAAKIREAKAKAQGIDPETNKRLARGRTPIMRRLWRRWVEVALLGDAARGKVGKRPTRPSYLETIERRNAARKAAEARQQLRLVRDEAG